MGSFRRAADELGLSPSSLSHTLRTLERNLSVRLLNRTTRSVAFTEAGERLLQRLGPALHDLEAALGAVDAFREAPSTWLLACGMGLRWVGGRDDDVCLPELRRLPLSG